MELIIYGTNYGGFYLPKKLDRFLSSESIVYSFGAGEDLSFDCLISGKLNCDVHIFDPTPRAIQHYKYVLEVLESKNESEYNPHFGGGEQNYWSIILKSECHGEKLKFFEYGINKENGIVKFYKPTNIDFVSCSISPLNRSEDYFLVQVKSLSTIMKENNHTKIDLLKLDIENTECDILEQMIETNIFPKILCIDFDLARTGPEGLVKVNYIIEKLKKNNYHLVHNNNFDMSFIRE